MKGNKGSDLQGMGRECKVVGSGSSSSSLIPASFPSSSPTAES